MPSTFPSHQRNSNYDENGDMKCIEGVNDLSAKTAQEVLEAEQKVHFREKPEVRYINGAKELSAREFKAMYSKKSYLQRISKAMRTCGDNVVSFPSAESTLANAYNQDKENDDFQPDLNAWCMKCEALRGLEEMAFAKVREMRTLERCATVTAVLNAQQKYKTPTGEIDPLLVAEVAASRSLKARQFAEMMGTADENAAHILQKEHARHQRPRKQNIPILRSFRHRSLKS